MKSYGEEEEKKEMYNNVSKLRIETSGVRRVVKFIIFLWI